MREDYCSLLRGVKCTDTYRDCLKKKSINLKENGLEMSKQIKRNLNPLFSKNSSERLYIGTCQYGNNLFSTHLDKQND